LKRNHNKPRPFTYFDAHCHIQESEFDLDREEVIARMVGDSVGGIVVGTEQTSSAKAISLASKYPFLFASVGVHPTDTVVQSFDEETMGTLARHPKAVAIGECGLDYYRMQDDTRYERDRQKRLFEGHVACAVEVGKPLMIHCRAAHNEMIDILQSKKREYGDKLQGNIHFFTASLDIAQKYFALDFSVSFSGVITFTSEYDPVVAAAPEHLLLSETDTPFASPPPYRGSRNEPSRVIAVVKRMAELRNISLERMADIVGSNASRIFKLPEN
jgi:TatD DNase family protein